MKPYQIVQDGYLHIEEFDSLLEAEIFMGLSCESYNHEDKIGFNGEHILAIEEFENAYL